MSRYLRFSLACLFLLGCLATAQDTRIDTTPVEYDNPAQPANVFGGVYDSVGNLVDDDVTYAMRVAGVSGEGKRYQSADV